MEAAAAKPIQSCPTLSDPVDCGLPGSSVPGIFQARVLEWVPLPSPNGGLGTSSSLPGVQLVSGRAPQELLSQDCAVSSLHHLPRPASGFNPGQPDL